MNPTQRSTQRPIRLSIRRSTRLVVQRVRGWCWPLSPTTVLVPAAAIVAVVVLMTAPMLGWRYPLWVQTSAQFHQMFALAGPIAGTAACWYATRFHGANRIWMQQPRAPRLGVPVVQRHLVLLGSWFVGAYVLALIPLVAATVMADGIGAPDLLAMVSGVLAMVAAVALGYALGTVVPSLVMVPITAVGFYMLLVVGNVAGESYAAIAPVLYLEPELGQREATPLVIFRIAVFVAVGAMAAGLSTRCLHRITSGTPQVLRRVIDVVAYAAAPVVLIVVSLINQPALFEVDEKPSAACVVQRDVRYCVHADQQPRLATLVDTVDPIIARYGTTPDLVTQVWDQSLAWGPIDVDVARGLQVAWLNTDGTIETDIATVLAGLYSCSLDPTAQEPGDDVGDEQGEKLAGVPGDVLAFLDGGAPSGIFADMTVADVQRWLAQHQRQLHTCTLTTADLPQP